MTRRRSTAFRVELLEGRDAPAALVGHNKMVYQDVDGDTVTVTLSRPVLTSDAVAGAVFAFNNPFATAGAQQLRSINVTALGPAAATGVGVTLTAVRNPAVGGEGFANVGQIDATGIDLGPVTIDGDLGRVRAGDAVTTTSGLKGLTVQSLGRFGTATGAPDLRSVIQGKLDFLKVKGDVKEAFVDVQGGADGKIGPVTVGGSVVGGAGNSSGCLQSFGGMGPVRIGGSVQGGSGLGSGEVFTFGTLAAVTVGGSLVGGVGGFSGRIYSSEATGLVRIGGNVQAGDGTESGEINAFDTVAGVTIGGSLIGGPSNLSGRVISYAAIGPMRIGGNVQGGGGLDSGEVFVYGSLAGVVIGGSLIGGAGGGSGRVYSSGAMGAVRIAGDLVGGSASGTATLTRSGMVLGKRIASVTLGGSLRAGVDNTSGTFGDNGAIRADDDIGSVVIKGSVVGNPTNRAVISARGQAAPTPTRDVAIGKLTVLGRVEYAQILAGVDAGGAIKNADAQVGTVTVGGDWIASSVAAGAVPGPAGYGSGDAKMAGPGVKDDSLVFSRIASLTVGGQALGTVVGADFYGVVAETIGSLKVGGTAIPLAAARSTDDFFVGATTDFNVHEV